MRGRWGCVFWLRIIVGQLPGGLVASLLAAEKAPFSGNPRGEVHPPGPSLTAAGVSRVLASANQMVEKLPIACFLVRARAVVTGIVHATGGPEISTVILLWDQPSQGAIAGTRPAGRVVLSRCASGQRDEPDAGQRGEPEDREPNAWGEAEAGFSNSTVKREHGVFSTVATTGQIQW